ncbi:MAG: hypothetical protein AABO58_12500 [Acidobacteriota bacterium]
MRKSLALLLSVAALAPVARAAADDEAAIKHAALDYIEGLYTADAEDR